MSLCMFHINIQGLTSKLLNISALELAYLFFCVSEHWLPSDHLQNILLDNYVLCSYYCREGRLHGGVAIFVASAFANVCFARNDIASLSVVMDVELCGLESDVLNIILVTIYRPPNGNFDTFMNTMHSLLDLLCSSPRLLLVTGDFNINFLVPSGRLREFSDLFQSFNLVQTINSATRNSSCLDNIFTNVGSDLYNAFVWEPCLSDHAAVIIEFLISFDSTTSSKVIYPVTARGRHRFHEIVSEVDWSFIENTNLSIDERFDNFLYLLSEASKLCFPPTTLIVGNGRTSLRWFTPELARMRETLQLLHSHYCRTRSPDFRLYLLTFKNRYRRCLRRAKKSAFDVYILNAKNRPRAMWEFVKQNQYRGNTSSSNPMPCFTAEHINDFFSNIALDLTQNIPSSLNYYPSDALNMDSFASPRFNFVHLSFVEVRDIIFNLKNSATLDVHHLNAKMIKSVINHLVAPLTRLINHCIDVGIYPSCLKKSKVIPVFKKGEVNDLNNYRPISIIPVISKVFEKGLQGQMVRHFEYYKLFNSAQFGFRKNKSTSLAITQLVSNITASFNNGNYVGAIFCDLSKAFDCLSSEILIKKLQFYNFSDLASDLVCSFLTSRLQAAYLSSNLSSFLPLSLGVPQGSILGPTLFLIYINDLPTSITNSELVLFADDTTLLRSSTDFASLQRDLELSMSDLLAWFSHNNLCLNSSKTVRTNFSLRSIPASHVCHGAVKFLGVFVDSKLTWDPHIDYVVNNFSKNYFLLRSLKPLVSASTLLSVYHAYIHSRITYGILVWGHCSAAVRLFKLQRRSVRVLDDLGYRDDCRDSFRRFGILTLPSAYILACLLLVRSDLSVYASRGELHGRFLRSNSELDVGFQRVIRSRFSCNYWCPRLFNRLPAAVRQLPVTIFRRKLKSFLVEHSFYEISEFLLLREEAFLSILT